MAIVQKERQSHCIVWTSSIVVAVSVTGRRPNAWHYNERAAYPCQDLPGDSKCAARGSAIAEDVAPAAAALEKIRFRVKGVGDGRAFDVALVCSTFSENLKRAKGLCEPVTTVGSNMLFAHW